MGTTGPVAPATYREYLRATLPETWTADPAHIRLIAAHLDAVERGEIDRLAIHMPPRHGKTETVTVRYGAYCMEKEPGENVLVTGYNERFARRLSRKARNIVRSRLSLADGVTAADEWSLPEGGTFMSRGVGSPPTGVGFRRIIIDDPIRRRQDAESETMRERINDWYADDLFTRLEPGGAIILVMTRWHEEDLGTFAPSQEPGRWVILNLAALAEEDDMLRRPVGAALWPERFDVEALEDRKRVLTREEGERSWLALYQQRPTPREGDFFKIGQIKIEQVAPVDMITVRAWDLAATAGGGDWSVGAKMGKARDGSFWILDVARGRYSTDERNNLLTQTTTLDGHQTRVRIPQDPGQAGVDQAQSLVRLLAGYTVKSERVTGSKESRADPFSAQVNAGNVRMVKAPWNAAVIEEMRTFPGGKNDDIVDALSDAFADLTTVVPAPMPKAVGPRVDARAGGYVNGLRW
jgi:predicted phage terminase large subunit-like protein